MNGTEWEKNEIEDDKNSDTRTLHFSVTAKKFSVINNDWLASLNLIEVLGVIRIWRVMQAMKYCFIIGR